MEKIVAELADAIERKGLSLSAASVHVGVSPTVLDSWLRGEDQPSAFFLQVLPGAVEDISRLYPDAVARK
jgi:transcriptional regulator with XRE-family HTH domain